jgi:hypothetical protein
MRLEKQVTRLGFLRESRVFAEVRDVVAGARRNITCLPKLFGAWSLGQLS